MTEIFKQGLEQLEMLSSQESTGLVMSISDCQNEYEKIIFEEANIKYNANGIYFRRYSDNRPSIAQIFIYDYSNENFNETVATNIHKKVWNSGIVPLFYIFTQTDILIFNSTQGPFNPKTQQLQYSLFDKIRLSKEIDDELCKKQKEYSARLFDNGYFLEQGKYKNDFNIKNSSYESLLIALKEIRKNILHISEFKEAPNVAHKLLVMSILLKYLEERRDEYGNNVFGANFFQKFGNANTFVDVFKTKGACLQLFDYLSNKDQYNGGIFCWNDKNERRLLEEVDLTQFAIFLSGKLEKHSQISIWDKYDFNFTPIELISNIYEEFLGKTQGVVYTPPFLVNFLINECMPLTHEAAMSFQQNEYSFKVIDPACGSGIFLVTAFKRLIQWWRIANNFQKPNKDILKNILRRNIYGIDKDCNAVQLTYFSLCLSLCDMLSPKDLYPEKLHFDNLLNSNFIDADFFQLIVENQIEKGAQYDLVIGNPPFGSFVSGDLYSKYANHIDQECINKKKRKKIPRNEISLLFAEQAIQSLLKKNGLLCFILPSANLIYYSDSYIFRSYFAQKYNIPQIIDFTHIARVLFKAASSNREGGADVATLALFAEKREPTEDDILHLIIKRTKPIKEKIYFEIDKYDFNWVSKQQGLGLKSTDRLIWKSNYLGGGRIFNLVERLSNISARIGNFIEEKEKNKNWIVGEGIKIGNSKRNIDTYIKETNRLEFLQAKDSLEHFEQLELTTLQRKYAKAEYLVGKEYLKSEYLTKDGILSKEKETLTYKYYYKEWVRKPLLFQPPLMLIREVVDKDTLPTALVQKELAYSSQILGIHCPLEEISELREFYNMFQQHSRIYAFYLLVKTGRSLVSKANSLLVEDIKSLPYLNTEFKLYDMDKYIINDVLDYCSDFRSKGEDSKVVRPVTNKELQEFGELYITILNSAFANLSKGKAIITESFIFYPFYFGKLPIKPISSITTIEHLVQQLLKKEYTYANLRIIRVIRLYDENAIYLIKPNQLRYWLKSVAINDADETFYYLSQNGL